MHRAGFIGLGNMGSGMAMHLKDAAPGLTVFNRTRSKMERFRGTGCVLADSMEEVARTCEVVFLSLSKAPDVESVLKILLQAKKEMRVVFDTSTVSAASAVHFQEMAADAGVRYYDCPISGGKIGAEAGTLSLIVGAEREEVLEYEYLLKSMGPNIFYMGKVGNASGIKIINNFMAFATSVVNTEAINLASHMGIPLDRFYDVILASSGANGNLRICREKVIHNDWEADFTVDGQIKDLELAEDLFREQGIPFFTGSTTLQLYRLAKLKGYGDKDPACLVEIWKEITGNCHE